MGSVMTTSAPSQVQSTSGLAGLDFGLGTTTTVVQQNDFGFSNAQEEVADTGNGWADMNIFGSEP